ncbi:DUF58 domain-containing protein [Lacipirellula parvula]|jgi:uncharacterized protein (DUF58 family)|uniref:DUF58 domain-containing protein n=1 Tax=Lacipirellula parvula TaxID=2650471 RepID=A0A5K7XEN4_9BACT|nr:DUF58 domain-containing protein [Lacipirellula parvula]BBO35260.1 hypothetical protein PLANPX_4872 [Lacipirellula parvula]
MLTDPAFIRRLDSLYLLARKVLGGSLQADRKTRQRGTGITFADYSEYYHGADYRAIDWRVFARFESLVIKLFELEEDATVYLLVDSSRSMNSKYLYARKLAAALGYIALRSLDRLAVYGLADRLNPLLDVCRGGAKTIEFLRALDRAETFGGDTDFTSCARVFQARHRRRGLVIVVSDFLFPGGFEEGLRYLQYHNHEVFCLQVQDEHDVRCDWKGDLELECVETGQRKRVTVTPREARRYEQAVAEWNDGLRACCARTGIGLASTLTDPPFESVIQDILRRGGLVA